MKELGRFFYQLAGYTYAGVMLTAVLNFEYERSSAMVFGFVVTIGFVLLGIMFDYINKHLNK